jgi:hypothetical protein
MGFVSYVGKIYIFNSLPLAFSPLDFADGEDVRGIPGRTKVLEPVRV